MKNLKVLFVVLACLGLAACMPFTGVVRPNVSSQNEIVLTPELKALLASNPRPKIVIRVPNPPTNVTEAEKFNASINLIEKAFLQAGFTVRDRALLETLMRSGNTDYQGIKRTIDTDLIIDVLALEFEVPDQLHKFFNKTSQKEEEFARPDNFVNCPKSRLECRVTIVDKGQLGGLFTVFASPCDQQEYEFLVRPTRDLMRWVNSVSPEWSPTLVLLVNSLEIRRALTELLTKELMKQLAVKLDAAAPAAARL